MKYVTLTTEKEVTWFTSALANEAEAFEKQDPKRSRFLWQLGTFIAETDESVSIIIPPDKELKK